jgi:hypothetical protein
MKQKMTRIYAERKSSKNCMRGRINSRSKILYNVVHEC